MEANYDITNDSLTPAGGTTYALQFDCEVGPGQNLEFEDRGFEGIVFNVIQDSDQPNPTVHVSRPIERGPSENELTIKIKKVGTVRSSVTVSFG